MDRTFADGEAGFLDALSGLDDVDVVNLCAERAMRSAGRWTAKRFAWPEVLQGVFLPRLPPLSP